MQNISMTLSISFVIIALLTVYQFYRATNHSKIFLGIISIWMFVQMLIGLSGFYENESTTPPRFMLLIMPPLVVIITLFLTKKGKQFLDSLNIRRLTFLHIIRVMVEPVLYFLFLANAIPEIMTFAGRNFDIISGITAPIIYYFCFVKKQFSNKILLAWNLFSVALLFNIVVIAILSVRTPFQQFGFDMPNVALTLFPFNWLPSVVVPIVLLSHLASIRQLVSGVQIPNKIHPVI